MVVCTVKYETVSALQGHGDRRPRAGVPAAGAHRLCGALDEPLSAAEYGKIQDDVMRVLSAEPPAA